MKRIRERAEQSAAGTIEKSGQFMESRWWLVVHIALFIPCLAALILLDSDVRHSVFSILGIGN
jgi:hypothetical protein